MKFTIAALACAAALCFPASALAQSDLSVAKTDSADPVTVGSQFSYTITVTNSGPEAATGVLLEDTIPNEVDYVSATPSQGTCELQGSKKVNCQLGNLASNANATVELRVTAAREGTVSNTATVSSTSPDPNQANNEAVQQTSIQAATPVMCAGKEATIIGTAGADTLTGTDKADVIAGLSGDDTIAGLDGQDILCGGRGIDAINAGGDNDTVKGGGDNDRIRGATGNDLLAGNGGEDRLAGGRGDDVLRGGPADDSCKGGAGSDIEKSC
jgi:uncharacterized repeat protein (TIGR01451 family)